MRLSRLSGPIALGLTTMFLAMSGGCNGRVQSCCCDESENITSTLEYHYCVKHSSVAGRWIQKPIDTTEWAARHVVLLTLYEEELLPCASVSCIRDRIESASESVTPGLLDIYDTEHRDAEGELADSNVIWDDRIRVRLIKCGFQHTFDLRTPE